MSSKKKTLEQLFTESSVTDGNSTTVSADFYYKALNLNKETVDAVNAGNQQFLAKSLEQGTDTLVGSIGDGDGASIIFETGTEGFTFQHHANKDETSDSGWDIFSAMENNLGEQDALTSAYTACHNALSELNSEEEGEDDA